MICEGLYPYLSFEDGLLARALLFVFDALLLETLKDGNEANCPGSKGDLLTASNSGEVLIRLP